MTNKEIKQRTTALKGNGVFPWHGEKCFHVAVVGTMSSGKSTLIDALLGTDCMPSANLACTSKIVSVCQKGDMKNLIGITVSKDGIVSHPMQAMKDSIKEWNQDDGIRRIILSGMPRRWRRGNSPLLVVHDTPGANDSRHPELDDEYILEFLQRNSVNLIMYVIDGQYNGTTDQKGLISKIWKKCKNVDILFVINKLDEFDTEKEDIHESLKNAVQDIETIGFANPVVIPISAKVAQLSQLVLEGKAITASERIFLNKAIQTFDDLTWFFPSTLRRHRRGRRLLALGRDAEEISLRGMMRKAGLTALRAIIQKKSMLQGRNFNETSLSGVQSVPGGNEN